MADSDTGIVYLDNNATTRIDQEVLDAMLPFLREQYANPSGSCTFSRRASLALDDARQALADLVHCDAREITFTSGATEAIASVFATVRSMPDEKSGRTGVLISPVEHSAMSAFVKHSEATCCCDKPDECCPAEEPFDPLKYARGINEHTRLFCLMLANNETGIVYPVAQVVPIARAHGCLVLSDAVQAAGKIEVDFAALGVDYMPLSAHKLHGPKGVGALIVRHGAPFAPLIEGGGQERGRRAGTENVAGIVGFGAAARLARANRAEAAARMCNLRDRFEAAMTAALPDILFTGRDQPRLPNTSHLMLRGVSSEALLARLDMAGVCVSAGSACAAGAAEPSHVLKAMGFSPEWSRGALRVSLSRHTTESEIDLAAARVAHHARALRARAGLT